MGIFRWLQITGASFKKHLNLFVCISERHEKQTIEAALPTATKTLTSY